MARQTLSVQLTFERTDDHIKMDASNLDLKMKSGLSSLRIWSNVRILRI